MTRSPSLAPLSSEDMHSSPSCAWSFSFGSLPAHSAIEARAKAANAREFFRPGLIPVDAALQRDFIRQASRGAELGDIRHEGALARDRNLARRFDVCVLLVVAAL